MARLLVTGAAGFVGRAVAARLARDEHTVVAAGRTPPPVAGPILALGLGDLTTVDWSQALVGVDAVIHCAARAHVLREAAADPLAAFRRDNRDATLRLARAAADAGVRRFVFLSTIGVNGGETHGAPFRADDPPRPHSAYAVAKWEAEHGLAQIAAETGLEVVTIRPPLVIGRDPKGNLGSLVTALRRGLPLPLGAVTGNRRDLVSLAVLADLVARAIDHRHAPGAPLLVSDGRPLSTCALVERLATLHGLSPRLLPVPPKLLGGALALLGRRALAVQLLGDLEVDIADTCRRLGWRPVQGDAA